MNDANVGGLTDLLACKHVRCCFFLRGGVCISDFLCDIRGEIITVILQWCSSQAKRENL